MTVSPWARFEGAGVLVAQLAPEGDAAKSAIALAAFGQLCGRLGLEAEQVHYAQTARAYAAYWRTRSAGGRGGATRRTFDAPGSFSAKMNLAFDTLLGTNLFTGLAPKECTALRETAGPFGWLLDERGLATNKTNIETELVAAHCPAADQADSHGR